MVIIIIVMTICCLMMIMAIFCNDISTVFLMILIVLLRPFVNRPGLNLA